MSYIDAPLSALPDSIDNFARKQDLTVNDLPLVTAFEAKYNGGDFAGANQIITDNPTLKNKIMNADGWNQLRDAIIALEHMFVNDIESYLINVVKYMGDYDPSISYNKYNVVDYVVGDAKNSYMAKQNNVPVGTSPTNTNYFTPQTLRGQQGASGVGLAYKGQWKDILIYNVDECVAYLGIVYQCISQNVGNNPSTATDKWVKILYVEPTITMSNLQPTSQSDGLFWFKIVG